MSSKKINLHAFSVTGPDRAKLKDVFKKMDNNKNLKISQRIKIVSKKDFRFERIEKISLKNIEWWYVDFSFLTQTNGLGKGSKDTPMKSIDFDNSIGEQFCYDTALLYDPKRNIIIVQNSFQGPRISQIQNYLVQYSDVPIAIDFVPILKKDIEEKLNKSKSQLARVQVKIDRTKFDNTDSSIEKALDMYSDDNEVFEVTVNSSKRKGKIGTKATSMFSKIKKAFDKNEDGIKQFKVSIINDDNAIEMLDLLKARLVTSESIAVDGGLFQHESRKKAFIRAYQLWVKNDDL